MQISPKIPKILKGGWGGLDGGPGHENALKIKTKSIFACTFQPNYKDLTQTFPKKFPNFSEKVQNLWKSFPKYPKDYFQKFLKCFQICEQNSTFFKRGGDRRDGGPGHKRLEGGGKTNLIGSQIFFKNFAISSTNYRNVTIILANNLKDYPKILKREGDGGGMVGPNVIIFNIFSHGRVMGVGWWART